MGAHSGFVCVSLRRPYTSFSKADRLGKAADWTYQQRQRQWNKQPAEDGDFTVVDNKQQYKQKQFGPRFRGRRRQYEKDTGPERNSNQRPQRSRREREFEARRASNTHWKRNDQPEVVKETSVEVKPSWEIIEQLDLKAMTKLRVAAANIPAPEDVKWAGSLNHYDRAYDRVTSRKPSGLQSFEHLTFHSVTTTDDPVIRKETRGDANVFATDAVLACIACAPRSVYSWDLVFHRIGNKLFIDKREDSAFDFLTVPGGHQLCPVPVAGGNNDQPELFSADHAGRGRQEVRVPRRQPVQGAEGGGSVRCLPLPQVDFPWRDRHHNAGPLFARRRGHPEAGG
eukprot:COSAG02_NODE_12766_length_1498_cov_1.195854_2_plen_340_part_00